MVGQAIGGHPFRQETLFSKGNSDLGSSHPTERPTRRQKPRSKPKRAEAAAALGMSDAEMVEFATEFRAGILGRHSSFCMCFAVSAPLVTLLEMHGVACRLAKSDLSDGPYAVANHFWIELDDGRALDPTADQFLDDLADDDATLLPPVYLGPPLAFHVRVSAPPALNGRGV